ncbi:MAG: phosphate signaling complex protein PhoU [Clostridiaceae bacterium]|nr:phosphate signaling complex protein PhoU [Clostridiaceae bacterium]
MVVREEFEKELIKIHEMIIRMGVATQQSISDAVQALVDFDVAMAEKVIANDDIIDDMERDIDKACLQMIVKQQPVAADLRDAISTLKLIMDLERIADHASDICEKVILLQEYRDTMVIPADVIRMSDYAKIMIKSALESYVSKNEEVAQTVVHMDDKVDALYDKIKEYLIKRMRQETESIEPLIELLLICKYFERISDHAQNVAEWVIFFIKGRRPEEK